MAKELTSERQALKVATRSTKVFRSEVRDLRRQLESRIEEIGILEGQLPMSEAARVRAECERDSLAEDVARATAEKAAAEQLASDLQDDFDVGVEEARYAAVVECRDATATENDSRDSPSTCSTHCSHHSTGPILLATIPPSDIFSLLFFLRKCLAHAFL